MKKQRKPSLNELLDKMEQQSKESTATIRAFCDEINNYLDAQQGLVRKSKVKMPSNMFRVDWNLN